ncbi:MAG: hypothetical protein HYZ50_11150 [Deltaproteobacteria bacterium]|nr:hypothetical protein [Deltaproteobacteria bacterium]
MSEKHVDLVLTYLQMYETYHTQKENMTWVATTVYLGAAVVVVASKAFWKNWSCPVLGAWLALILTTAVSAFVFVWWQFDRRFKAAAFLDACADTAVRWLQDKDRQPDLEPVELPAFRIMVPREIANAYRSNQRDGLHLPLILTLLLMLLWTAAAAISIVSRWEGP